MAAIGFVLAPTAVSCHSIRVEFTPEERAWLERDERLRRRAVELAGELGRDVEDMYRALRHLRRTPGERLELGLRHGRLHPDHRRTAATR